MGHWLGSVGHGVIFNLGPAKEYPPVIIEMYFSHDNDMLIAGTDCFM